MKNLDSLYTDPELTSGFIFFMNNCNIIYLFYNLFRYVDSKHYYYHNILFNVSNINGV